MSSLPSITSNGTGNFSRSLKAADTRHVHIHQDYINGIRAAPFHGILTAAGLAGNFNPFYIFQNASYPCAHQFVVINKKDVDQRNILQN